MGRVRPEIKKGYYSFPVEKHVIFYLILEHYIAVIRILHGKMDIDKNLIL
jgi:toxin ParE1/3/4